MKSVNIFERVSISFELYKNYKRNMIIFTFLSSLSLKVMFPYSAIIHKNNPFVGNVGSKKKLEYS